MVSFKVQLPSVNKNVIKSIRELCTREKKEFVCWICNESVVEWHPVVPTKAVSKVTSGVYISDVDDAYLLEAFTREGQLLIVKHDLSPVLVENDYCFLVFLKSVFRRQVKDRLYQQRCFTVNEEKLKNVISAFEKQGVCKIPWKSNNEHIHIDFGSNSEVSIRDGRSEAPRSYHVTTPVPATSNFDTSVLQYVTAPCYQATGGSAEKDTSPSASAALVKNRSNIPGQFACSVESRYRSILSTDGPNELDCPQANSPPPRHVMHADPVSRLDSFSSHLWPKNNRPSIQNLVDTGFFYTGRGDLVRCFQCGIGMKDWAAEDDPLTEHVRHAATCPFLLRKLGRSELQRLKNATTQQASNSAQQGSASNSNTENKLPFAIRSPQYQTMESRLATFNTFPGHVTIKHNALAIAGLFFTGKEDLCRCFTCDGGLKSWVSTDDPIEEHAKYFPNCAYVKHLKGDSYVKNVQQKLMSSQASGGNYSVTDNGLVSQLRELEIAKGDPDLMRSLEVKRVLQMGFSKDAVRKAVEDLRRKGNKNAGADEITQLVLDSGGMGADLSTDSRDDEAEYKHLKNLVYCKLCLAEEANVLFLPCAHHHTCKRCAKNLTTCPACGTDIDTQIQTYMV